MSQICFQDLPTDILYAIVKWVIGGTLDIEDVMFGAPDSRRQIEMLPWYLSAVCKSLARKTASMSNLWTLLFIAFVPDEPFMVAQLIRLQCLAARAQSSPLHVYFSSAPLEHCDSYFTTLSWLSDILPRVQTFAMWTMPSEEGKLGQSSPPIRLLQSRQKLPSLERLSLNTAAEISEDGRNLPPLVTAPNLRQLRLCGVPLAQLGAAHFRCLEQVDLVCCPVRLHHFGRISTWWPDLVSLRLNVTASFEDSWMLDRLPVFPVTAGVTAPIPIGPFHSPHSFSGSDPCPPLRRLAQLSIEGPIGEYFYETMERSSLPALRQLRTSISLSSFSALFFERAAPNIQDLTVAAYQSYQTLHHVFPQHILRYTGSLQKLSFEDIWFEPGDLMAMSNATVALQLEVLRFRNCRFVHSAKQELVAVLAQNSQSSRSSGTWSIRALHIIQIDKTEHALPNHIIGQVENLVGEVIREDLVDF
ncbi:hypothetical protein BKA62DRAFT_196452 [Auriculariales sp. MPI-PUGE-AT-0066]|nr:hypothetical protein BKA62DRAFT_196452 [Auriculariales sp. MPI-PUGE-AT-0066]